MLKFSKRYGTIEKRPCSDRRRTLILEDNSMKLFDALFGSEKKETTLLGKQSRAVAIVVSVTLPEDTKDGSVNAEAPNYGMVEFKYRRNDKWICHKVILREDVGEIAEGDQWIVKFDEDYTRIMAVHCPLSKNSVYRIAEDEE